MTTTIKSEFCRKLIHMVFIVYVFLIDLVPLRILQLSLLILGVLYYVFEELRLRKIRIPFLSAISNFVMRPKEDQSLAFAPLTLLLGIILTMEIYSTLPVKIAIIAATVGDSISSLTGMLIPKPKIFWNKKKTVAGTLANIISVSLLCVLLPLSSPLLIVSVGLVSGFIESLDLEHVDNLMIPLTVGAVPYFL